MFSFGASGVLSLISIFSEGRAPLDWKAVLSWPPVGLARAKKEGGPKPAPPKRGFDNRLKENL
jgi:hypothetical protein